MAIDELNLLGLTEEEVVKLLSQNNLASKFRFLYTCDPLLKDKDNNNSKEKRVIRVQSSNGFLDILVGYFERSSYSL